MSNINPTFRKGENNETRENQYISEAGPDVVTWMADIWRPTHPNLDPTIRTTGKELPIDTTSGLTSVGTDFNVWAELHSAINLAIGLSKDLDDKYQFSAKTKKHQPIHTILQQVNIRNMLEYANVQVFIREMQVLSF